MVGVRDGGAIMARYPRLTVAAVYAQAARSDRIGPLAAIGEAGEFRVGIPRPLARPAIAHAAETCRGSARPQCTEKPQIRNLTI